MPKIVRRASKFDADGPFSIFSGVYIDDAALLVFRRALIYQAEHLSLTHAGRESQQAAIGVHGKHARGFAEGFAFTVKSDYFDRHNQLEALAAPMRPAALSNL
ncbi:MAG: hypothetical protein ACYC92_14135 [Candidatus Acidiferrales bacterium]